MGGWDFVVVYLQACTGGQALSADCWPLWQFFVFAASLIFAIAYFISLANRFHMRAGRGASLPNIPDALRTTAVELQRPPYAVGDEVRTPVGVGVIKRVLPGGPRNTTAYSVSLVSWRSGIIFNEDQIARHDGRRAGQNAHARP